MLEWVNDKWGRLASQLFWFYQRLTRGWDDRELWSLDVTISKFVLPRIKRLKEIKHGWPDRTKEDGTEYTWEDWNADLDEMIWSFEYQIRQWDLDPSMEKDWQAQEKRCSKGMELFGKYFRALWD